MEKLVQQCLVPGCESASDNQQVSFFDFPSTDRELIRMWNKALGFRANCKHIPDPKVCEKHFQEEEVDRSEFPIRLNNVAVPTIGVPRVAKVSDSDGARGSSGIVLPVNGEPSYCRLCAKQERQPLKHNIEKMMKCTETARLLEICLESSRSDERLPAGVCDACSHMMKYVIKFVRNCCGAQGKLSKMFDEKVKNESMKTELQVKQETTDEGSNTLPTDYLMIGIEKEEKNSVPEFIIDEVIDAEGEIDEAESQESVGIKLEPTGHDSDSDYEHPGDEYQASSDSGSDSEDEDYEPNEEHYEEMGKNDQIKIEGSEYMALDAEKPLKRRGRPRKGAEKGPKGPRKRREKRDKSLEEKPASMSKQICQVCGKILSSSATFNVHMMTHTQQKDIVCPICDRRFYVKQQLKIHMESIHEKKDFVCSICGLKCRWRKSLRRHMLLHDDNPYKHKCTYCDKAFARPNQLRYHVMKHTGDRVYCDLCGADYRFNYMLTQHKIRKHGIIVEGVQLYKQSARKKKSDGGELNPRRNRFGSAGQPPVPNNQPPQVPSLVPPPSVAPAMPHLILPEHERTNQSDLSHVSELGSPATAVSYATITSPEPSHFSSHPAQHPGLQQHHHHSVPQPPMGGFNGSGLNMTIPPGLVGFPGMNRQ